MKFNAFPVSAAAVALALFVIGSGDTRAQTADCDISQGLVDAQLGLFYRACDTCPNEDPMVGWHTVLSTLGGELVDEGTTNAAGYTEWVGNGGLINTCVPGAVYFTEVAPPAPSPYPPEVIWANNSLARYDAKYTNGDFVGLQILRFGVQCRCQSDGERCTDDTCDHAVCAYDSLPYDPGTPETCNGSDDDCDGDVDEGLPAGANCQNAKAIGCADKTREGFMSWADYPLIAACGGAWSETGLDAPMCQHGAGNHGADAAGDGCTAADLCPAGWHVCYGPDDVAQRLGDGDCSDAVDPHYPSPGSGPLSSGVSAPPGGAFFMTAASDEGATCGDSTEASGGLFGCGTMGAAVDACGVLDRGAGSECAALHDASPGADDRSAVDYGFTAAEWAWSCGGATPVKTAPDRQGGVLCCKDSDPSLAEVCDGIDNDLDALTDEVAFGGGALITVGSLCREGGQCGTLRCTSAAGWECAELGACAIDDACDGIDDDGDGATDEDFVVVEIHCGIGACAATGQRTCVGGMLQDACAPGAPAEASDVTCDGIDGDCDGDEDEDFDEGISQCGVGACQATGFVSCLFGKAIDTCKPTAAATDDATCDAVDDDCDGSDDEDVPSTPTTCGSGVCAGTGALACVNGVMSDSCRAGGEPTDETCDGVDDDCDGGTDEDHVAVATACGVGACAGNSGSRACANGSEVDSCDPLAGAGAETCNAIDDDCDGATDEDLECGTAEPDTDPEPDSDTSPDSDPERAEPTPTSSSSDGGCHGGGLDLMALGAALGLFVRRFRRSAALRCN